NVFDGQGLALNGVKNATVDGNTFQNINDDLTANGTQHRGLVIEDAFGTHGVSNVSVTNNVFDNIDSVDGSIAFQRFTDGTNTATIDRLNNIDIQDNQFSNASSIYLNPTYFGPGAAISSDFSGDQVIVGTSSADVITDTSGGAMSIFADAGANTIAGG